MNITQEQEQMSKNNNLSERQSIGDNINRLRDLCYKESVKAGWHTDMVTGEPIERNKGEMMALIHSEVSEMLHGERKDLMDDKLPHRKMAEVEAADIIIRTLDYCGTWGYDVGKALVEKIEFNRNRHDFKKENREKSDGKRF